MLILKVRALCPMHGWVTSDWQTTENSRRARFYTLTETGRSQLEDTSARWRGSAAAVERILQAMESS